MMPLLGIRGFTGKKLENNRHKLIEVKTVTGIKFAKKATLIPPFIEIKQIAETVRGKKRETSY